MGNLKEIVHQADLCVVGGGMAGICAAIAAARNGIKVVLMHDRPVLGGNASSEIRMWICGAGSRVRNLQETGIMEEIALDNMWRNPQRNYTIWDTILYEKVRFEKNITMLLNCSCCKAEMDGDRIASITGFQLTTYTWHTVHAAYYADCSGDGILAPLTGAEHRIGRECREETGEEFALDKADPHTMGMSLLLQCRETDHPVDFVPPPWAYDYPDDDAMHNKPHTMLQDLNTNFYWIELGGMNDTIHDTEEIRDELLKIAFGAWDHMKNHGDHGADNWELEWVGFLPGKRESVRFVGDYILKQDDVESARAFEDEVAYGGWQIDNHLPGGFNMSGAGGAHLQKRRLKEPYGIPFRSLYSRNIDNLMFAGRNISATHIAFSTVRVMGTCGIMGQAVGTAAVIGIRHGLLPREIGRKKIREVQELLMEDDCFLPHIKRPISRLSAGARLSSGFGDCEALRNGIDRRFHGQDNGWFGYAEDPIVYSFGEKKHVRKFRLIADSDLDREYVEGNPNLMTIPMPLFKARTYRGTSFGFPECLLKSFRVEILTGDGSSWQCVYEEKNNHQRLIRGEINAWTTAVRLIPLTTHGSEKLLRYYGGANIQTHIFAFEVQ